jgi:hypothetical protein
MPITGERGDWHAILHPCCGQLSVTAAACGYPRRRCDRRTHIQSIGNASVNSTSVPGSGTDVTPGPDAGRTVSVNVLLTVQPFK